MCHPQSDAGVCVCVIHNLMLVCVCHPQSDTGVSSTDTGVCLPQSDTGVCVFHCLMLVCLPLTDTGVCVCLSSTI